VIRSTIQLVLDLFGRESSSLRVALGKDAPARVPSRDPEVPLVFSARRRKGWRLVKEEGGWICQVPEALRESPAEIQTDLREWIRSSLHPFPGSRKRRRDMERRIFTWMGSRLPDRVPPASSRGRALDLQDLFTELNEVHFQGMLEAVVRWSPRIGGLSTHQELRTIDGTRHLITISQAYDGYDVPRVSVAGVLFHEMCHIAHPPRPGRGGKRIVHHKEFRMAERKFPGWVEWREWEKKHLARRVRHLGRLLTTSHN
jgi:hypothetical protein